MSARISCALFCCAGRLSFVEPAARRGAPLLIAPSDSASRSRPEGAKPFGSDTAIRDHQRIVGQAYLGLALDLRRRVDQVAQFAFNASALALR